MRGELLLAIAALLIGCGVLAAQAPSPPPPPTACGPSTCDWSDALRRPSYDSWGASGLVWVGAEYLLWGMKNAPAPALVTAGPPGSAGILGQPGTVTLFGPGSDLTGSLRSGARFTAGFWCDDDQTFGLEGSYFFLAAQTRAFDAGGTGAPGSLVVARPFFNALTGRADSEVVAAPGAVAGVVGVAASSLLQGCDVNTVCNLSCSGHYRLDALAGFRYLDLNEGLGITENLTGLPAGALGAGSNFLLGDRFDTHNQFYGGQVGIRGEGSSGRLFATLAARLALGDTHQTSDVNGVTFNSSAAPGSPPLVGGLLALPSNSGHFTRDRFTVVPELNLGVGVTVAHGVRVSVGYTLLYWSGVLRPGDQVDRAVNPAALPINGGPAGAMNPVRPAVVFKESDFWAQGLNVALEFRY